MQKLHASGTRGVLNPGGVYFCAHTGHCSPLTEAQQGHDRVCLSIRSRQHVHGRQPAFTQRTGHARLADQVEAEGIDDQREAKTDVEAVLLVRLPHHCKHCAHILVNRGWLS